MAFAAPIAFAIGGGALYGQIGAAIGFLAGSWLYNTLSQEDNEVIDPGAEEMPRPNQALRGTTMPVLYGTNRVPSQIVWTHDFEVIRKESGGGGGGKGGGSAGGKAPSGPSQVTYEYKWDFICHLGMTTSQLTLFGGWVGDKRISTSTISAIGNDTSSSLGLGAVLAQLFGTTPKNQRQDLIFSDSFWHSGGNEDETWPHLESVIGHPIRWPNTAWIGLKDLELGSYPRIPQLSWEVGKGSFSASCNTTTEDNTLALDGLVGHRGTFGDRDFNARCIDANGYIYCRNGNNDGVQCIDPATQTIVWTLSKAEWIDELNATPGGEAGWQDTVGDNYGTIMVIEDKLVFLASTRGAGASVGWELTIATADIPSSGKPTFNNAVFMELGPGTQPTDNGFHLIALARGDKNSDLAVAWQDGSSLDGKISVFPSVNEIDGGGFQAGFENDDLNFPDQELPLVTLTWPGTEQNNRMRCSFFGLPTISISPAGLPTYGARIFHFVSKEEMDGASDWVYANSTLEPTYGAVSLLLMTDMRSHNWRLLTEDATSSPITGPVLPDLEVVNDWTKIYNTETEAIPFDDEDYWISDEGGELDDGSPAAHTPSYYNHTPNLWIIKSELGVDTYVLIFQRANGQTHETDAATKLPIFSIRAALWDPINAEMQFLDNVVCRYGDADLLQKGDTGDRDYLIEPVFYINPGAAQVCWMDSRNTNGAITSFGCALSLSVSSERGDLFPPEIIYDILTNNVYGLGYTASQIDTASYNAAVVYCQNEDFKVSVQYRREEGSLKIIQELLDTYNGYLTISGNKIKFGIVESSDTPVRTIDNHRLLIQKSGEAPIKITKGARQDTFNRVRVNFFSRELDYAQDQVEVADEVDEDLNGPRMREFPARFVMSKTMAMTMAERALWNNIYVRDTYDFKLGWKDADLEPGDLITIVDSFHTTLQGGKPARILLWKEDEPGQFSITAREEAAFIASTSGEVTAATSASADGPPAGIGPPVHQTAYELPCTWQTDDQGRVYISYATDFFAASAKLYVSPDGTTYSIVDEVSPFPISGRLRHGLPNNGEFTEDVEVILFPTSSWTANSPEYGFNISLDDAGPSARAVGASVIRIGSEMLAYEGVNLVAQNHYRFDRVYRGWGGTLVHGHSSGDYFTRHDSGVFHYGFNDGAIGQTYSFKVQPVSIFGQAYNISSIDAVSHTILGRHYRPQNNPTPRVIVGSTDMRGITQFKLGGQDDIVLEWRDSARKSGYGTGGFGTGVGGFGRFNTDTISRSWRVEVVGSGGTVVRCTEVSTVNYNYTNSNNFADNGAWHGKPAFKVTAFNHNGDAPRTETISLDLWP